MTIKMYGIRYYTGELLGFREGVNPEGTEGESVSFTLESVKDRNGYDNIWLVSSQEKAEKVLKSNTEWYNASYDTPRISTMLNKKDLKVVEVIITYSEKR